MIEVHGKSSVVAHRGNMSEFPENTLAAFKSAIECGAGWLELDIQRTSDGLLVVTHDTSALRVSGVDAIITANTYAYLNELNFGAYWKDDQFYSLPLLEDVFNLIKGKNIRLSIQPKNNGLVKQAYNLATVNNVKAQVAFNDINCEYLIEVKQLDKDIPVFWDRLPGTDFETDIYIAKHFGFDTLMYLKEAITDEKVKVVKENGIRFGACVVNDTTDMKKLLAIGVEIFYTDYPKKLLELVLKQKHV